VTINVAYAGINFVDVMARRGDAAYASAWPYAPGGGLADVARTRAEFVVPVVHSASGGVGSAVAQLVPALGGGLRIGP